jgi:hypothetical protein
MIEKTSHGTKIGKRKRSLLHFVQVPFNFSYMKIFSYIVFMLEVTHSSYNVNLQVVRHFWEQNDTKGAISALRKLPDHSVGISWKSSIVMLFF